MTKAPRFWLHMRPKQVWLVAAWMTLLLSAGVSIAHWTTEHRWASTQPSLPLETLESLGAAAPLPSLNAVIPSAHNALSWLVLDLLLKASLGLWLFFLSRSHSPQCFSRTRMLFRKQNETTLRGNSREILAFRDYFYLLKTPFTSLENGLALAAIRTRKQRVMPTELLTRLTDDAHRIFQLVELVTNALVANQGFVGQQIDFYSLVEKYGGAPGKAPSYETKERIEEGVPSFKVSALQALLLELAFLHERSMHRTSALGVAAHWAADGSRVIVRIYNEAAYLPPEMHTVDEPVAKEARAQPRFFLTLKHATYFPFLQPLSKRLGWQCVFEPSVKLVIPSASVKWD